MKWVQNKEAGFNIVELLVIVIAVGVIGVGGWFVYQHNRPQATNAAANPYQATNQQTYTTPAPTASYLTINEWGVRLPLSDAIKDAYYIPGISSKGTDGLPNQMWIGLKSLDASGCAATNNSGLAMVFRALPTETDPVSGELVTQKYPNGATIGNHYYGYENFIANIASSCKVPQAALQSADAALTGAAKSTVSASAN